MDRTFNASPSARFHLEEERGNRVLGLQSKEGDVRDRKTSVARKAVCFWRPIFLELFTSKYLSNSVSENV